MIAFSERRIAPTVSSERSGNGGAGELVEQLQRTGELLRCDRMGRLGQVLPERDRVPVDKDRLFQWQQGDSREVHADQPLDQPDRPTHLLGVRAAPRDLDDYRAGSQQEDGVGVPTEDRGA